METPIGKFRTCMTKFLDKLDSWASASQKKELEKFRMKYNMGMRVSPRDSLNLFVSLILPHADHIMRGDDEYFLNSDIGEDDPLKDQIKVWWPELEYHQRKYIKDTFKLLLMLATIASRHEELRQIVNRYRTPDTQIVF